VDGLHSSRAKQDYSTDRSCQALYITLVLKYPLERFLARAGRVREKRKKRKEKNGIIPRRTGCSNAKRQFPRHRKDCPVSHFFLSAASPTPFPYNTPGPVCWMDLKKRKGLENRGNLLKFGGKTQRLDKNGPLSGQPHLGCLANALVRGLPIRDN